MKMLMMIAVLLALGFQSDKPVTCTTAGSQPLVLSCGEQVYELSRAKPITIETLLPARHTAFKRCVVLEKEGEDVVAVCDVDTKLLLLRFPTQPEWRWPLRFPTSPGTKFYYEQKSPTCRLIHEPFSNAAEAFNVRLSEARNCDQ